MTTVKESVDKLQEVIVETLQNNLEATNNNLEAWKKAAEYWYGQYRYERFNEVDYPSNGALDKWFDKTFLPLLTK